MADHHLSTPLTADAVSQLRAGDNVYLSGEILTARDAAHRRLVELLDDGKSLPVDLSGQIIYYVGPAPARPGKPIGSAGPTTSTRMDPYTPRLLAQGLKGMIGKGSRSEEVRKAIVEYGAVYLAAVGGAAALLARCIQKSEIIAYEDLGPEAIRRLYVQDFPVVVINDVEGGDLYETGVREYGRDML